MCKKRLLSTGFPASISLLMQTVWQTKFKKGPGPSHESLWRVVCRWWWYSWCWCSVVKSKSFSKRIYCEYVACAAWRSSGLAACSIGWRTTSCRSCLLQLSRTWVYQGVALCDNNLTHPIVGSGRWRKACTDPLAFSRLLPFWSPSNWRHLVHRHTLPAAHKENTASYLKWEQCTWKRKCPIWKWHYAPMCTCTTFWLFDFINIHYCIPNKVILPFLEELKKKKSWTLHCFSWVAFLSS